jgi:hypothetical protein
MLIATTDRATVGALRQAVELGAALVFEVPAEEADLAAMCDSKDVESLFIPAYDCDICGVAIEATEAVVGFYGVSCEPCQMEGGNEW